MKFFAWPQIGLALLRSPESSDSLSLRDSPPSRYSLSQRYPLPRPLVPSHGQIPPTIAKPTDYYGNAKLAFDVLQDDYNFTSGLYNHAGWWNNANCITTMAHFSQHHQEIANVTKKIWPVTFSQAQKYNLGKLGNSTRLEKMEPGGFLNNFYDDEGWWALAWIAVYDVTKEQKYLKAATEIFNDMLSTGYNCWCGGIWWDKQHSASTAIANELFFSVAAHLARRVDNEGYYLKWALDQWNWFEASGLINGDHLINDGLDLQTCKNNHGKVWTYNQGVVIGGLIELYRSLANKNHLDWAIAIASGTILKLTDNNNILHDPTEPDLGGDSAQFKGIFMRNLRILQQAINDSYYKFFLEHNAESIWKKARDDYTGLIGPVWSKSLPFDKTSIASHCSGLDALVGAAIVL